VAKYLRKVESVTWLTDEGESLDVRVNKGLKQFSDPGNKPSIYSANSPEEIKVAVAALAWNKKNRDIDRIKRTQFVFVTDTQLAEAQLKLVRTRPYISWKYLRKRHFEITVNKTPCSNDDLARLLGILIQGKAKSDRISAKILQQVARKHAGRSLFRDMWQSIRCFFGLD